MAKTMYTSNLVNIMEAPQKKNSQPTSDSWHIKKLRRLTDCLKRDSRLQCRENNPGRAWLCNGKIAKNPRTPRQLQRRELLSEKIPENCHKSPWSIQEEATHSQEKNYPNRLEEQYSALLGMALLHKWEIISPRLNAALGPPKNVKARVKRIK